MYQRFLESSRHYLFSFVIINGVEVFVNELYPELSLVGWYERHRPLLQFLVFNPVRVNVIVALDLRLRWNRWELNQFQTFDTLMGRFRGRSIPDEKQYLIILSHGRDEGLICMACMNRKEIYQLELAYAFPSFFVSYYYY